MSPRLDPEFVPYVATWFGELFAMVLALGIGVMLVGFYGYLLVKLCLELL